ncbi:hypothetical protein HPB49_020165 [Dermacentor silvarum]|uniref:Uncharacterized protein n=1 Tax=Dermacentor silvarum TaxID=543639 RepID=A0ACB8DKU9_DERSI|nr:hypothetical protein HPB49_020165 [Dermacentor silvarum]
MRVVRHVPAIEAVVLFSLVIRCNANAGAVSTFLSDITKPPCPPSQFVLLWLAAEGPHRAPGWMNYLKHPVQQWTVFGEAQLKELKDYVARNIVVWVLTPASSAKQRKSLTTRLSAASFDLSLVRFMFLLGQEEQLVYEEYPEVACILIGANDTTIDVATNGYSNCVRRKTLTLASDFCNNRANSSYGIFSGIKMVVVTDVTLTSINITHKYTRAPEATLLLSMLKYFNATIVPYHFVGTGRGQDRLINAIHRKKADLSLLPAGLTKEMDSMNDIRAINAYRSLVFFSRRAEQVPPRITHALLSSGTSLATLTGCGLIVLGAYICQTPFAGFRTSVAGCVLFLVSNLVGRGYPVPAPSARNVTRLLVAFWALGVLSYCAYLQSVITSNVNIPTKDRKIKNTEDLKKYATQRQVLPCFEMNSYSQAFIKTSTTEVGKALRELLTNCRSCVNTKSGKDDTCLRLTRRGTHVYIRVYDVISKMLWRQFGVMPSEDTFRFMPNAPMMPKGFHCGSALRRLVTEIREHGHHQKMMSMEIWKLTHKLSHATSDPVSAAPIPFWDHFLVYSCGIILACVAFLVETCWACTRRSLSSAVVSALNTQ